MTRLGLALALLGTVLAAGTPATAGLRFYASRDQFDRDFPDADLEDFEAAVLAAGESRAVTAPLSVDSDDGVFAPGDIVRDLVLVDQPGPGTGPSDGLVVLGAGFGGLASTAVATVLGSDRLRVELAPPDGLPAIALDLGTLQGRLVTVEVFDPRGRLLGGRLLLATADSPGFLGIARDDGLLGRLEVASNDGTPEFVDQIAIVPEPSAGPLLWLAVGGLGWRRGAQRRGDRRDQNSRRRRRRVSASSSARLAVSVGSVPAR